MTQTLISPANSPLNEADPRSLDDLFASDPEELSDEDITRIVEHLQSKRAEFKMTKAEKSSAKKGQIPMADNVDDLLDILDLKKLS